MLKHVEFRLPRNRDEIEFAYSLVCTRYREKDYLKDWPFDLWITPYCLQPETITILALVDGEIIGTGSIFRRTKMGLPVFNLYPQCKDMGERGFEIGKLAISKEVGDSLFSSIASVGVVMGIFSIMYRCGLWFREKEFSGGDFTVYIAVVPSHRPFYAKLGFKSVNSRPNLYQTFKDVEAYCMVQSFSEFFQYVENHSMLRKFFGSLEMLDPNDRYFLTWEDVIYFAKERTNLWDRMNENQREYLACSYGVRL